MFRLLIWVEGPDTTSTLLWFFGLRPVPWTCTMNHSWRHRRFHLCTRHSVCLFDCEALESHRVPVVRPFTVSVLNLSRQHLRHAVSRRRKYHRGNGDPVSLVLRRGSGSDQRRGGRRQRGGSYTKVLECGVRRDLPSPSVTRGLKRVIHVSFPDADTATVDK